LKADLVRSPLSVPQPAEIEAVQSSKATIVAKIVAGNEPAMSGGFGSQVTTHDDDDAM